MAKYVIGLDYGSDSARAVMVDVMTGMTVSTAVENYPRWAQGLYCDPEINQYRQHPLDYIEVMEKIVKVVVSNAPEGVAEDIIGMAFDTTGSTPCFVDSSGTPLALTEGFKENPNAMFILWKDHTANAEAIEINEACHKEGAFDYTAYEGGTYASEWFWAKALHVLRTDEAVREAAYSIVEHCDWMPALLTGCSRAEDIVRGRCAAGHKAMWNEAWDGLPSEEFLCSLDPLLAGYRERLYTKTVTAGSPVGSLTPEWAGRLGLSTDVVVGVGSLDCHAGAVGANVAPHRLVRIIGTSTCDIMVSEYDEIGDKLIRGICGQVDGSVLPGMIGIEAGQSSFGDVYAWMRRVLEWPLRNLSGLHGEDIDKACARIIPAIERQAADIPAGKSGVIALDWFNGRRTPDSDPMVKGAIAGLTLGTTAPMIYRALVEATAFGSRAITERMLDEGVRIDEVVGIGGIALKSPFVMQILADVMNMPIKVYASDQACALGASMFAATAAGAYPTLQDAQAAMAGEIACEYVPRPENVIIYDKLYKDYLSLGAFCQDMASS